MNMPVPASQSQLPAHLQDFSGLMSIGEDAVGGISVGKAHPRISIKQNRFRLINDQGQEFVVPALHLDVIVVGVNKNVSKIFYQGAFNPADPEPPAPNCFSDNGIGPSTRSQTPQSATCAACPHNVWGSKVTPSGTKLKSCSDSKKFAVVLADNPAGLVYELRVPAASMENVKNLCDMLNQRKEPLPGMVLRVTFDETSQFPKLIFTLISYISPEQKVAVLDVLDGDEAKECVGKDDVSVDPNLPQVVAVQSPVPVVIPSTAAMPPQVSSGFIAPTAPIPQAPAYQPQQVQPVAPVYQPPIPQAATGAFNPMAPQQTAAPQPPAFNPMVGGQQSMQAQQGQGLSPVTRKRRTKAEMAAAQVPNAIAQSPMAPVQSNFAPMVPPVQNTAPAAPPAQPNFQAAQPVMNVPAANAANVALDIPAFLRRDMPGATAAAASVPAQPAQTDAALDNLLAGAMT